MFVRVGDIDVHVRIEGPPGAPPLVLLHSLGTCGDVWEAQAAVLSRSFRVIRPDVRGHGLSEATPGDYSMAMLAGDLAGLLDALAIGQAHIGGISIGGMIAQCFAALHPKRVASLILCDTAMIIASPQSWSERIATVRTGGVASIADAVLPGWVTRDFLGTPAARSLRRMLLGTDTDGYCGCAAAIAAADLTAGTAGLAVPALVVVGKDDRSTPVEAAEALHRAIAGSNLVVLSGGAHIPTGEMADEVTGAIHEFLLPAGLMPAGEAYEAGLAVRKQVLGVEHVERSLRNATEFDRDFQHFITEMAWGRIWTRPGLDRRTRSLITLAITAALGRDEEFKLHLRATRNTGASQTEIAEMLMHTAIYAGVPAANAAFRMAREVFREGHE